MSDEDLIRLGDVLALPFRLSPSLDAADGYYVSVDAIRGLPAVKPWIANCIVCGRVVDTREESEGGDAHGCEYADGWVCSRECDEIHVTSKDQSEPMRCAECDCANGGADCTWIMMPMDQVDQPGKEVMPDDAAEIDGLSKSFDASPGVTAGAASPDVQADSAQIRADALRDVLAFCETVHAYHADRYATREIGTTVDERMAAERERCANVAMKRHAISEDAFQKGLGVENRHCALEAAHIASKIREGGE